MHLRLGRRVSVRSSECCQTIAVGMRLPSGILGKNKCFLRGPKFPQATSAEGTSAAHRGLQKALFFDFSHSSKEYMTKRANTWAI